MKALEKKRFSDEARNYIMRYLEAGGEGNEEGIELSEKQAELLDRWRLADEKLRDRKYKRSQIVEFLIAISAQRGHKISRDTAFRDIVNAEYVFCSSYPLNKQFRIMLRIELLETKINDCYIDKDYFSAGQLEKVLQKYYDMYKEFIPKKAGTTVNFIMNGDLIQTTNNIQIVQANQDKIINRLEQNEDY